MRRVPHVGEDFWSGSTWGAPVGASAYHSWVGVDPRLDARDGDAGYAGVIVGDPYLTIVGANLSPFSPPAGRSIRVDAQVRFTGTWPGGTVFVLGVTTPAWGFSSNAVGSVYDAPLGEWVDLSFEIPRVEVAEIAEAAQAGDLIVFGTGGDVSDTDSYDVSYLAVFAGQPPMRLMQRGDGLGMGSGRVYSPGTRQGSTRVFGTH